MSHVERECSRGGSAAGRRNGSGQRLSEWVARMRSWAGGQIPRKRAGRERTNGIAGNDRRGDRDQGGPYSEMRTREASSLFWESSHGQRTWELGPRVVEGSSAPGVPKLGTWERGGREGLAFV